MTAAAPCRDAIATCFQCGRANPAHAFDGMVEGESRQFCCAGCRAIAQTIGAAGLGQFYTRREAPDAPFAEEPAAGDEPSRLAAAADSGGLIEEHARGERSVSLLLEGIHCAACTWLIESYLGRQPGVREVNVNFATRRARVRWDGGRVSLDALLRAIGSVGYRAYPYDRARRETGARRERRTLLLRAGIALLAMMQVMMFAIPAYLSDDGVEPAHAILLSWASLIMTLPVVTYSAAPFFRNAWRDVRMLRAGMDLPVALGIAAAFIASAWSTLGGGGPVYYDSVTMFVALLLVGRLFELRSRQVAAEAIESVTRELPALAERLESYPRPGESAMVAAGSLRAGDHVRVQVGDVVPADGVVVEGRSSVEEALLTGESWPKIKSAGDDVLAGSINRESPLIVRVSAAGADTRAAALGRLVERAANARPRIARIADRVASWFIVALLVMAALAAVLWWRIDPTRAIAVVFAMLVVSCPCAMSLATPAALASAAGALARRRILAVRADALEALSRVTHVIVDKTGTLTCGRPQLIDLVAVGARGAGECLSIACALERGSSHPIAAALLEFADASVGAEDVVAVPGCGVEGTIAGRLYRLGEPRWAGEIFDAPLTNALRGVGDDRIAIMLAGEEGWLARMTFGDPLRPGAAQAIAALHAMGIGVSLVSGDRAVTVRHVADAVGIDNVIAEAKPENKWAAIVRAQRDGAIVAMVGDGVNDAPALAQANVSIAFGSATTLTRWTADVVTLGEDVRLVADAIRVARRTYRIIRQNLLWAVAYNAVAIPLAAFGFLTPLGAALGMSISSSLVVLNALRLLRQPPLDTPAAVLRDATPAAAMA
ncbi:MAG TPA: heavy metal translocating P-type ATPase [Casimicrobiaceae bacterium]